jgi:hypothetical protein
MKQADEVKVAIHTLGWVTKDGFTCRSWSGYRVAVGRNPFGPRGGTCGRLVDGRFVTRQLSSRKKAEEIADQLREDLTK